MRDAEAFVDSDGDVHLMVLARAGQPADDPFFVLHGNICCEDRYDDRLNGKRYLVTRNDNSRVRVSVSNRLLIGELDFRQRRYDLSLARAAAYDSSLRLTQLAGVYVQTESTPLSSAILTLAIDAQGQLTGSHTNGCAYNGHVAIPDPARNMVRLEIELSGCRNTLTSSNRWNGKYEGLGVLKSSAEGTVLYHSLVGATWLGPQSPAK